MGGRGTSSRMQSTGLTSYDAPLADDADGFETYDDTDPANRAMGYRTGGEADRWARSLTPAQREAVEGYTNYDFAYINAHLRGTEDVSYNPKYQREAAELQTALSTFTLDRPITTHRVMTIDALGIDPEMPQAQQLRQLKALVGGQITDQGFTSSAVSTNIPGANTGNVHLHIQTPAGRGIGAYIAGASAYGDQETEFLYNSGSHFRVLGVYRDDRGHYHINARYDGRN